jgi:hypothetical protein
MTPCNWINVLTTIAPQFILPAFYGTQRPIFVFIKALQSSLFTVDESYLPSCPVSVKPILCLFSRLDKFPKQCLLWRFLKQGYLCIILSSTCENTTPSRPHRFEHTKRCIFMLKSTNYDIPPYVARSLFPF